jgi:methionyl aminopeptidase
MIKNASEILKLKKAGKVLIEVRNKAFRFIEPGKTSLEELDAYIEKLILEKDCTPSFKGYGDHKWSSCLSPNEVVIHGACNDYVIQDGDILDIDIGVCYDGYHVDSAHTYPIGKVTPEAKRLINIAEESLNQGIAKAKDGNKISDISKAIQKYVESNNYSVVKEFAGHGIGKEVHEEPMIPNFHDKSSDMTLKEGMVICIEPMVNEGVAGIVTDDDGWTIKTADRKLSAHFEHTVVITKGKPEVITKQEKLLII